MSWCRHITRSVALAGLLMSLTLSSGCVTAYGSSKTRQQASEREDLLILKEKIGRLEGRIEGLEMDNRDLRDELSLQQRDFSQATRGQAATAERRLAELERQMRTLEANRRKDKQEIVDSLTGTISKLMKSSPSRSSSSRRAAPSSGYGYEHSVGPGQTLSAIAKEYGVSARAIIDANEIENPDRLQVGQVLFIPE